MKVRITTLLLLSVSLFGFGQAAYKIDFKIKGLKDTTVYLAYYEGEMTLLRDTARIDHQGAFTFDGKKPLLQGYYLLAIGNSKVPYSEFIVSQNQKFSMETDNVNYIENMKTSDTDNKLFYESMILNMTSHKEAEQYIKVIRDSTLQESQKKEARAAYLKINEKVVAYQNDVIARHPATLTARTFKANKQIDVPEPPKRANGTIDSTFQLKYYRQHFFDNFDLADDALLRLPSPMYKEKVDEYLDKLFIPQSDTIMKEIKKLAAIAKKNKDTYRYFIFNCVIKYQNPEIMGLDEVFVHVYDTYFATGEMDYWLPPVSKASLKEFADKIRLNMLGKVAPNLIMQDANLQPKSMYDIKKKYTILFFYSPTCGHCREETPKLVDFYKKDKLRFDLEIFAVDVDTSMAKMREFIKEMKTPWITVNGPRTYLNTPYSKLYYAETTPTIYILDEKKKIIAKKPPVDKIGLFLENYEKMQKRKAVSKGS